MLNRTAQALMRRSAARYMSSEAPAATKVKLNFCLPHEAIYEGTTVHSVILPGAEGEYGITGGHVPYVAQLKPGVLQILHEEGGSEPEKYFVAGGYAMTHEDSTTDVVCPEAVKIDDIDTNAVSSMFDKAKSSYGSATAGSIEHAEAQIEMEVTRAMGLACGITLN